MQVSFNPQQNHQQFGMAMHSNEVINRAIGTRVKNIKAADRVTKAFERAKGNDVVDINLMIQPDGKSISANIFSRDGNYYFSQHSENWFTKLFKGPEGFIEDLVVKAEKAAQKVQKQKAIEEKLNNL